MNATLDLGLWRQHRIRLARQTEATECGLAALAMVAGYHGYDINLGALRQRFQPSMRGTTLKTLMAMADQLELMPRAVKLSLESLPGLRLPAILHWDMNHYVVLERVSGERLLIHDPAGRSEWMTFTEISPHFTGVALELTPSENFEPQQMRERLRLSQLWQRITGLKRAILQTVVLTLVMEAFVLASPYYMQLAIDTALPSLDRDLLSIMALGFGLFVLVNAGASLLRSFVLLAAGTSLGFGIATNIARRLFRLPIAWFEKRHVGDVLSRFQSVNPIQQFMTQGAVSGIIDGSLAIFTLLLMFVYSPKLALLALTAFVAYAVVRIISFAAQRSAQEEAIVAGANEQLAMIETLRGIVTLRLFNREMSRHMLWQTRLTDSMNANAAVSRVRIWQTTLNMLIVGLELILSVWIAVHLVMDGGFSVGMVFAYMAYKSQFLQRGSSLIDQSIAFRMLGLHLDRLADVALTEQDGSFSEQPQAKAQLDGRVELQGVSYRYSPTDPRVLHKVDLVIESGEHVAITGPSGGGKTTLAKILLSLSEPEEGELIVDGATIRRFGYQNYREQIAAVLQDDSLFSGSLADNIALFDDEPDGERIIQAAKAAAIDDDIVEMPMGYDTFVGDMGSTLSGGQKQRLLLARALYRQPRILVMDEGTSHLDAALEQRVNGAIAKLGITRIIIAHRLETILSAKRILLLDEGRLTDVTDRYKSPKKGGS